MRNPNCIMPYSAHSLKQLSEALKLHQQIIWVNPNTNQVAVRKVPARIPEQKVR